MLIPCIRQRLASITFILVAIFVLIGCENRSTSKKPEQPSSQPIQATPGQKAAASEQKSDMDLVRFMEVPAKEGYFLQYRSNIDAFNFPNFATLSSLDPEWVWEYQIRKSSRAIAVVDGSGDAIVIIYDASAGRKKTFALDGNDENLSQPQGWLLHDQSESVKQGGIHQLFHGPSRVSIKQERIRRFLANPQGSSGAFRLKGRITIETKDGYVQRISFFDVETKEDVPPNNSRLRSRIKVCRDQLDDLTRRAKENPGDKLLEWNVQEEKRNLRYYQRLLDEQTKATVQFTNGQIVANWVRKPRYQIDWP